MFSTMGQIIFCDDLILRVDDSEDLSNVTEWLIESTEYRPSTPESCTVRTEMTPNGKFAVILVVWLGLIVFTSLYFYFCEWRLFPNKNRLKEMENSGFGFGECAESGDSKLGRGMNKSRSSFSSGVSCDGTCCNTDMTSGHFRSSRASSPTWTTSDTIPASTARSRFASLTSPTSSGYSSFRGSLHNNYNDSSTADLVQFDRSPRGRRPRGRDWMEFGGRGASSGQSSSSSTITNRQTVKAKYRSLRV